MFRSVITRAICSSALLLSAIFSMAQFNNKVTLKIGDPAPAFQVQEWVRGTPFTQFEKGKIYVLDFWATWCGGCIASFPHISALAEKYKGKVSFTSVDVYENIDSNNVDPVAKVKDFLKTPRGQKLTFGVAVDGNSRTMWNSWIATIRRTGVPTTYVIDQEGKIAWVDVNLDHLDWVLQQVVAGTWDREKAAAVMQQKDATEDMMFAIFRKDEGDHKNDWKEVLAATEMFEKQFPDRTDAVSFCKFMALAEVDKTRIPALLNTMASNPLTRYINLGDAAGLTLRRKDLTGTDYAAVAKALERMLQNPHPGTGYGGKSVKAYEELADTYFKAGNAVKAASFQEKAIAMAKKQKANTSQMKKMQGLLVKYKSAATDK